MARGDGDAVDHAARRAPALVLGARPAGPFAIAIVGAALFSVMAVGGTVVLGRITDDVLTPGLRGRAAWSGEPVVDRRDRARRGLLGAPDGRRGAAALLRPDGPAADAGALVPAGHRPLPRRARCAGSTSTPPASCSPTPTPTASGRPWRCSPFPSRSAWCVLIGVSMALLATVDWVLFGVGVALFPGPRGAQQRLHEARRAAGGGRPGPGRRRVERRPRELRGRARREDARPRGSGGGADARARRGAAARSG